MAAIPPLERGLDRAAQRNDTIQRGVLIGKPLSLISQHAENTIIGATGRSNGVDIDGIDNAGLANVVVTEFFMVAS
jgi:hypothetical protein